MPRGRESRKLSPDQIDRLTRFRVANRYSLPQLRSAMSAPFGWETLKKALAGRPVWVLNHSYIVQWLDRFVPARALPDGKAAAAGDRQDPEEPNAEETETTNGTVRGSR